MEDYSPFGILKKKETSVRLSWGMCELIANYYEFPTSVFLLSDEAKVETLVGTRKDSIKKKIKILRELEKNVKSAINNMEAI